MENYFKLLNDINVNDKTEKKKDLTYLSWAWAWGEVKKLFPDTTYTVYENSEGWNYFTDGRTCWVKTGVTVQGIEHIEYLPVMDYRNVSIPADKVTSFDVNKAIQRSLTKAVARHGLGLYIYAGEDLPEEEAKDVPKQETKDKPKQETNDISEKITDTQYDLISDLFDDTMTTWLDEMYFEARKVFVDELFSVFEASGCETLSAMTKVGLKGSKAMIERMRQIRNDSGEKVRALVKMFFVNFNAMKEPGIKLSLGPGIINKNDNK